MSPDHDQAHLAACIRRHGPRLSPLDADRAGRVAMEYAEGYARQEREKARVGLIELLAEYGVTIVRASSDEIGISVGARAKDVSFEGVWSTALSLSRWLGGEMEEKSGE